jgi:hypothetical protein
MILLNRPYQGYAAGSIIQLQTSTEAALIAQGFAVTSAGPVTTGAVTVSSNIQQGRVAIAAGASSVVVTHPSVTTESKVFAVVAQAAADGTLLRVERILCAAGSFTIYGTANATATTVIDWALMLPSGLTTTN